MEIIYKGKNTVAYKMVPIGEAFSCRGTLYMRTPEVVSRSTGTLYNAVSLDIDGFAYFNDNDEVIPVKAQLVVS